MGVAADHLVVDRTGHVLEGEGALLFSNTGVEHHLQQQVAEFFLQIAKVVPFDGVGHLIGLFHRIGGDGGEALRQVPGAAALRIA